MTKYQYTDDSYKKVLEKIRELSKDKENIIVAIDGRCGSGKTTIAQRLQNDLSCELISMDDFFLRPEQRTEERYEEPGGNVDYERAREVLEEYTKHNQVTYQPFDCQIWALGKEKTIHKVPILLVEGSYSCHPTLQEFYDYKIFIDVDHEIQLKRIENRNGPERLKDFIRLWIPYEEKYFNVYNIEELCSDVIDTSIGG